MLYTRLSMLAGALVVYTLLLWVATTDISDRVHDIVRVDVSPATSIAVVLAANLIPLAVVLAWVRWDCRSIFLKRLAFMCLLKGVIQFVTVVPGPKYTGGGCQNDGFSLTSTDVCVVDMMFSGHTGVVFLLTQSYWRWLAPLEAVLLVVGKFHYISDTLVSMIVCSWIEYMIPLDENLPACTI